MREIIQSVLRFSWAMSLLGINQIGKMFTGAAVAPGAPSDPQRPGNSAGPTSNAGGGTSVDQISQPSTRTGGALPDSGSLNTARCVVLGEGLAAGVGDFTLSAETQVWSFPAQIARQMSADLPQRLIQAPGIANFPGFPSLPVRVPAPLQTTVLEHLPPGPVSNLAVPEFRLADALELHPRQPLIHRNNAKQTAVNLIWGLLPIAQGRDSLPTQLEYAVCQSPTFAIVELGYYEALEAAVNADSRLLHDQYHFASQYARVLSALKGSGADVLVLNIPNPFDTAHFSTVEAAARIARVEPSFLLDRYGLNDGDLVTLNGLNEIGFQIFRKSLRGLPSASVIPLQVANEIRERINGLNHALTNLAEQNGALLYDLAALLRRVAQGGYQAGTKLLTNEYL